MDMAPGCSYHLPIRHVATLIALFTLVPAAAGELLFGVIIRRDIPYDTVIWLVIVTWDVYWFLLRFAYAVDVEDGMLHWKAPLRSGAVPIATLRRVRPSRIFSNIEIMETANGTHLLVWAVKGFDRFSSVVAGQRPSLHFHPSLLERLAARLPVRTSFRA